MGLDHALLRKYKSKNEIERTIKALDFGKDEENGEIILVWRKDYTLHNFFEDIKNCGEKELNKRELILFLNFLELHDGEEDEHWEGKIHDYTFEITSLKEIIKNYDKESYVYYYWAWW